MVDNAPDRQPGRTKWHWTSLVSAAIIAALTVMGVLVLKANPPGFLNGLLIFFGWLSISAFVGLWAAIKNVRLD